MTNDLVNEAAEPPSATDRMSYVADILAGLVKVCERGSLVRLLLSAARAEACRRAGATGNSDAASQQSVQH